MGDDVMMILDMNTLILTIRLTIVRNLETIVCTSAFVFRAWQRTQKGKTGVKAKVGSTKEQVGQWEEREKSAPRQGMPRWPCPPRNNNNYYYHYYVS